MASYSIPNPPSSTSMIQFRSRLDNLGSVAKQCRFYVRITPSGVNNLISSLGYNTMFTDLSFLCEAAEFPGRGFDLSETRYYGPAITFPFLTKYMNEVSFSFICRNDGFERQLFDDWLSVINPTNNFNFNYRKNYMANIDIFQLSEEANTDLSSPKTTYLWSFVNAWPAQVHPQNVTWADQDILRLSVSFVYSHWYRPGRDATPGGSPTGLPGNEQIRS